MKDILRAVGLERTSDCEIHEKIEEGGMRVVLLAVDTRLGRQVAVKTVSDSGALDVTQRQR